MDFYVTYYNVLHDLGVSEKICFSRDTGSTAPFISYEILGPTHLNFSGFSFTNAFIAIYLYGTKIKLYLNKIIVKTTRNHKSVSYLYSDLILSFESTFKDYSW